MILRRGKRNGLGAIAQTNKTRLFTGQKLLNYHPMTSHTKAIATKHVVDSVSRLVFRLRNDDTLTSRQPVCLNHDGRPL